MLNISLCLASTAAVQHHLWKWDHQSACAAVGAEAAAVAVAILCRIPARPADAFAYKLLLMSRYQSDCINVAASSVERRGIPAMPGRSCQPCPAWVPYGPREAFIRSYSCIAGLMLIFPGNAGQAIDVWITLTWWLCIIYAAEDAEAANMRRSHNVPGRIRLIFHSNTRVRCS